MKNKINQRGRRKPQERYPEGALYQNTEVPQYGTYISDQGDYSYADDPHAQTFHQYGDCVVRWDGQSHDTYEWEFDLHFDGVSATEHLIQKYM